MIKIGWRELGQHHQQIVTVHKALPFTGHCYVTEAKLPQVHNDAAVVRLFF
jgi:hypothetical protein